MFGIKKKNHIERKAYDTEKLIPVIHASICTGEKVAGFKDKVTGKFEDVMLIRGEKDLQEFCAQYGIDPKDIKKEW